MCGSCDAVRAARRIGSAEEYYRVLDEVRALVRAGALRLLVGSCSLSEIGPDRPWPSERMSHAFICRQCGARFRLNVEPFEGKGGDWMPLDGAARADTPAPQGIAARLAAVDWQTAIVSAIIGSGWWLIVVGILTLIGFPIAAWLTPAALLMAMPMARHYVQRTKGRGAEDRRFGASVLGGLMGSDMGAMLAVWAAFFIPTEIAGPRETALLLIVLTAAGAAGGAVLAGYAALGALRKEDAQVGGDKG